MTSSSLFDHGNGSHKVWDGKHRGIPLPCAIGGGFDCEWVKSSAEAWLRKLACSGEETVNEEKEGREVHEYRTLFFIVAAALHQQWECRLFTPSVSVRIVYGLTLNWPAFHKLTLRVDCCRPTRVVTVSYADGILYNFAAVYYKFKIYLYSIWLVISVEYNYIWTR